MRPHSILSILQQRLTIVGVALLSLMTVLCGVGLVPGTAQSSQDDPAASVGGEREFKSTVPEHVPIRVKLKNEQTFKKRDNDKWARELEIEVKNTGGKPIYFMYMLIVMPEMVDDKGHALTFQVFYGRKALMRLTTPIQPDDVPIRLGESYDLKVSETQWKAFEATRHKEKVSNPKKIEFEMQLINFGDGTGVRGQQGSPVPKPVG